MRRLIILAAAFLAAFLAGNYLLPLVLPFLLGAALAAVAESMVQLLQQRLHLPRAAGTAIGVSMAFAMVAIAVLLLAALVVRELGLAASALPDLTRMVGQGLSSLESWLLTLAAKTPESLAPLLTNLVTSLFSGGSALLEKAARWLLSLASGLLGSLPGGALGLGTVILSAYMISARLPQLRSAAVRLLPESWRSRFSPAMRQLRRCLGGWVRSQLCLAAVVFVLIALGLLLLRVPYAPLLAAVIAVVDAVPLLGTGTVLLPWSLICLLQGDGARAVGLLALYAVAALTRSALEPRLLGRQLGLDPLVTLMALYVGCRLWGVAGMLFSPLLAVLVTQLLRTALGDSPEKPP